MLESWTKCPAQSPHYGRHDSWWGPWWVHLVKTMEAEWRVRSANYSGFHKPWRVSWWNPSLGSLQKKPKWYSTIPFTGHGVYLHPVVGVLKDTLDQKCLEIHYNPRFNLTKLGSLYYLPVRIICPRMREELSWIERNEH